MPSIFICSVAKQCLHWLRFILCVHWKWELGVELAVPNRESAPTQYNKYKCHMDIVNGPLALNCRPFFLVRIIFSIFPFTHLQFFVNSYFESIINNGPCETYKWTIQMDKILWFHLQHARCLMHNAQSRGNGSHICTPKIGPIDRTRWNVFVVHRSISVPAHMHTCRRSYNYISSEANQSSVTLRRSQ